MARSRKSWNNLLIFLVVGMFCMLLLSQQRLTQGDALSLQQDLLAVVYPHARLIQHDDGWRTEPEVLDSNTQAQLLQLWQQLRRRMPIPKPQPVQGELLLVYLHSQQQPLQYYLDLEQERLWHRQGVVPLSAEEFALLTRLLEVALVSPQES